MPREGRSGASGAKLDDVQNALPEIAEEPAERQVKEAREHSRTGTRSHGVSGQLPPIGTTPPTPRRSPRTKRNLVTSAQNLAGRRTGPRARPPHLTIWSTSRPPRRSGSPWVPSLGYAG